MITFEIAGLPKIITNGSKGSWRSSWGEARRWHRLVVDHVVLGRLAPIAPHSKARLKLTRYSSTEPDFDNLASSFKHVIDGLVKAGILENDKPANIGKPIYDWQRVPRKQGKITIEVQELTTEEN